MNASAILKKLVDFLLIFLLIFFTLQFFNKSDEVVKPDGKAIFKVTDSKYSIPASVWLIIDNQSPENVTLNTCNDIRISSAGDIITPSETPCSDIVVESGKKITHSYAADYQSFATAGKYQFDISLPNKEVPIVSSFEIVNKGIIAKVFTAFVYAPMYNMMMFLLDTFSGSLGWAIVAITIIIRIVLMYPQHKMMVSQKKLQAVQPKIKAIQEKYKGQQQILGVKLMELYKKEKVNPMGSCGFLLIQMPILLVIYNIILGIKDPVHYYHVYSFLQSFKLTDINFDFYGLDLLGAWGIAGILLGLTVWGIQYLQVKMSLANTASVKTEKGVVLEKKKESKDYSSLLPDPDVMNKFMLYGMPAMVAVFTYTLFAGVWVYWGISTLFMTIQQFVVNKIIKKQK